MAQSSAYGDMVRRAMRSSKADEAIERMNERLEPELKEIPELPKGARCPYCHAPISQDEILAYCEHFERHYHPGCLLELGNDECGCRANAFKKLGLKPRPASSTARSDALNKAIDREASPINQVLDERRRIRTFEDRMERLTESVLAESLLTAPHGSWEELDAFYKKEIAQAREDMRKEAYERNAEIRALIEDQKALSMRVSQEKAKLVRNASSLIAAVLVAIIGLVIFLVLRP